MSDEIVQLRTALMMRFRHGEHLVLHGPRGSGKSTLVAELHARFAQSSIPCGLSVATASLDDITRTLARAYPQVNTMDAKRRIARARLLMAADRRPGVLLLDHVTAVNTQMLGFLRRLRGGIAGVLIVVDVDVERDYQRLWRWHLGTFLLRMPLASTRRLRRLLRACCVDRKIPPVAPRQERQIIRAARGRPGWIVQCAQLLSQERYWGNGVLHVSLLCVDAEITLRQGDLKLLPTLSA